MLRMLDHVVLVVPDLDEAVRAHEARGFTVTPGGEHAGGLTHNALVAFADGSYLELIAFHDVRSAAAKTHRWWHVADRGGGWADFALLSDDLVADVDALGDLVTLPPTDGGRTRPDGTRIAWRSAVLASPLPFLIQDVTPREVRVPAAAAHPSGAAKIARVTVGARGEAVAMSRYSRLIRRGAPAVSFTHAERDGITEVVFAS